MNIHNVCLMARAAIGDGFASSDLNEIAALGASGRHPGNEARDFRRLHHREYVGGLRPQELSLTLQNDSGEGTSDVMVPVLAPYEVMHFLYVAGKLERSLLSPDMPLKTYWEKLMSQDWAATHPMKHKPHLWDYTIPICFFTDGAEVSKATSLEGCSNCMMFFGCPACSKSSVSTAPRSVAFHPIPPPAEA